MPRTITVTFADGSNHVYQNAPDDVTPDLVEARATQEFGKPVASLDGGRKSLVDQIPGLAPAVQAKPDAPESFISKKMGELELPVSVATGMVGGAVGGIAGLAKGLFGGKYGTQQGVQEAGNTAADVAHAMTYQPRTQTGQDLTATVGKVLNDSGIIALAPVAGDVAMIPTLLRPTKTIADMGARSVVDTASEVGNKLSGLLTKEAPEMSGMGAATTADSLLRATRAENLGIQLSKGQRLRDYEQLQFERETAKNPEFGGPIREADAVRNEQLQSKFDALKEQTGANSYDLLSTGDSVVNALTDKRAVAKKAYNKAYGEARASGQMEEPVNINSLIDYLDKKEPDSINAPVLTSIKQSLKKVDPDGNGIVTINNLEELRKLTTRGAEPGTANGIYGHEVLGIIDKLTEGKGGELYQNARSLYKDYASEFKDQSVINDLLRNKRGTTDRAVALEDVVKRSVLGGKTSELSALKQSLLSGGDAGVQAWKDLQGQTLQHIKDFVTSNSSRDIKNNPIISPDKMNKLVDSLDKSGKLDVLFDKPTAESIRELRQSVLDILTSPPGTVNTSNTSSALQKALEGLSGVASGLPFHTGAPVEFAVKLYKNKQLKNRVAEALNDPGNTVRPESNALSRAATARP